MNLLILFILACCDVSPEAEVHPPSTILNSAQMKQIQKGRIADIDGENCEHAELIVGLIRAPKEKVWKQLEAVDEYVEFFPGLESLKKYTTEDGREGLEEVTSVWGVKTEYSVIRSMDKDRDTMTWDLDTAKKNGIKDTRGRWVLEDYKGECLVSYCIYLDTGSGVKNFFVNRRGEAKAKQLFNALKKRVEGAN